MSDFWDLNNDKNTQSLRGDAVNNDDWDNKSEASGVSNLTNTFSQLGTEVYLINYSFISFYIKFLVSSFIIHFIS